MITFAAVDIKTPNVSNLVKKKLTITQKLVKLKAKLLLIMIVINILLFMNFTSYNRTFYCKIRKTANLANKSDTVNFLKKTD